MSRMLLSVLILAIILVKLDNTTSYKNMFPEKRQTTTEIGSVSFFLYHTHTHTHTHTHRERERERERERAIKANKIITITSSKLLKLSKERTVQYTKNTKLEINHS